MAKRSVAHGHASKWTCSYMVKIITASNGAIRSTIKSWPKMITRNAMSFDIVTANPPFSRRWWTMKCSKRQVRFTAVFSTKGDYAFLSHMVETIAPKITAYSARVGVVVPHGVLFRGAAEGKIRKQLIDDGLLDAVIGLPEKLLLVLVMPAAILIFKKEEDRQLCPVYWCFKSSKQVEPKPVNRTKHRRCFKSLQVEPLKISTLTLRAWTKLSRTITTWTFLAMLTPLRKKQKLDPDKCAKSV